MRKALTVAGATFSALQGVAHGTENADQKVKAIALALHDGDYATTLTAPLNVNARNMYASHSSHASHASHASHSSGSGASYSSPVYTPAYTPPVSTTPSSPAANTLISPSSVSSRPSADQLQLMIMRVQAALYARGYDPGAIDGEMSDKTKQALRLFQAAHGLSPTAKMTTETLNALGVALTP
jgi:His-Xaa-Ser repeat protein HxsA